MECSSSLMKTDTLGLASLLITGWGVLYSVSLGWSIYSLLDRYPRLIRFGSIWNWKKEGFLCLRQGEYFGRMLTGWSVILVLVFISLYCLVRGAIHFGCTGWKSDSEWIPVVFALIGLAVFIIPLFINRAVWGCDLFFFPKQFRYFVDEPKNQIYWQGRFSVKTMQKLYSEPEGAGWSVLFCSSVIVGILSWAVSGWYPTFFLLSYDRFWIGAPLVALLIAFLLHHPWPADVKVKNEDLPPHLRQDC